MNRDSRKPAAEDIPERVVPTETLRIDDVASGKSTVQIPSENSRVSIDTSGQALSRKYVVLERVADGGMGVLYLAQDRQLGRFVAVKRLNPRTIGSASMKRRMMQEAKVVAALRHPHIVHIYELGEDEDGPYIVMEYVSGPPDSAPQKTPTPPFSLADRVHRSGSIDVGEALALIIKIARAVEHAHHCGVIHRDLKPSNILYDENMEPKIVDFGLARAPLRAGGEPLTLPGERFLSLGYGAPEQERDASRTDERADVYGLGALLFFSLTGQNPRFFRPDDVPDELRMPILKALEPDRDKRWASVSDFLETLLLINTPDVAALPSVRRTWRCKWCDTVNPVSIRYCGRCGWDGGESCFECGSETRSGVPFCGNCGADLRDYEQAVRLHAQLEICWNKKEYRQIVEHADGISGFTPIGAAGRRLRADTNELKTRAEQTLKRAEQLRQLIPFDISSGAYARAGQHIEEYNAIAGDEAFRQEAETLHGLMVERYLETARIAIDRRRWDRATQACRTVLNGLDAGNIEATRLLGRMKFRRGLYESRLAAIFALLMILAYLLSAAPVYVLLGRPEGGAFQSVYRLAGLAYKNALLQPPLEIYASRWGVAGLFDARQSPAPQIAAVPEPAPPNDQFVFLKQEFRQSMDLIQTHFTEQARQWPQQYMTELSDLKSKAQSQGDYEEWERVQLEMLRFEDDPRISETDYVATESELLNTQRRFHASWLGLEQKRDRDASALIDRYVRQLKDLRRIYTQEGDMDQARRVNEEIFQMEKTSPGSASSS